MAASTLTIARGGVNGDAALSLHDVSVARAGRRIVEGVSFDLQPGRAIILKGPNGSGKTTLLRAIAGLSSAEKGTISIGGSAGMSAIERRHRAVFCSHADALKSQLSVRENALFWRALYNARTAQVDEALGSFDLLSLSAARAGNLSAGQRRRLSLARLLIAAKPLWLLDEPTASMDAVSSERLERVIAKHLAAGGAALIATHDKIAVPNAQSFVLGATAPI